jgi:hypothetical protein
MRASVKSLFPPAVAVWGLLWRATVLFPAAFLLMTLFLLYWGAVYFLPVAAVVLASQSQWEWATFCILAWIPLLYLSRWGRLHIDRHDKINSQENL